jgi:hypothetical protein
VNEKLDIYVPLLNEGTYVSRPTTGIVLAPGIVRLEATPNYDPTDEEWEFPPGAVVEYEEQDGYVGTAKRRLLVARRLARGGSVAADLERRD